MERKKAVVTGGSSGIGRGVAYSLAKEGYDVVFSYRSKKENARKVLAELRGRYPEGKFEGLEAELSRDGAGVDFFRQAVETLGGLDLLVNNAGVTILESVFDLTEKNMDYLYRLLFRNYVILMREAATYMAKQGVKGSIINISSVRGKSAHPGDLVYGGIKAALNRACQSVALDVAAYGIRVNNILPGATRRFTPEEEAQADPAHLEKVRFLSGRIPLERYGTPEDIGNAVVFLASEKASYITGVSLAVDGGLSLPGLAETAQEAESGWGRPPLL
ncbi:MAG: SDR family oxidoreductase [Lachnospiraceae bacterium]|nr:SDR family oxidoreductase [Lachnospiraceae bacterium]MCI9184635.1 SDR family oxidoreductase [Lachnospiraceae bacterium]